jgi:hypothetical protein
MPIKNPFFTPDAVDSNALSKTILSGALTLPDSLDSQVSFTAGTHHYLRYAAANTYLQTPESVRDFLAQRNARFIFGLYADQVDVRGPQEKLLTPTSNDARLHQNQYGGFYDSTPNAAYTLQYVLKEDVTPQIGQKPDSESRKAGLWKLNNTKTIAGITRHEVWHSVDKNAGFPSRWPSFTAAYKQDIADLGGIQKLRERGLGYFLQEDSPTRGASETFAEIGAGLNGGGCRGTDIMQLFSRTTKVVAQFQRDLIHAHDISDKCRDEFLSFAKNPQTFSVIYPATLAGYQESQKQTQAYDLRSARAELITDKLADRYGDHSDQLRKNGATTMQLRRTLDIPSLRKDEPLLTPTQATHINILGLHALDGIKDATGALTSFYDNSDATMVRAFHPLRDETARYFAKPAHARSTTSDRIVRQLNHAVAAYALKIQQTRLGETALQDMEQLIWLPPSTSHTHATGMYQSHRYQTNTNSFHNVSVYGKTPQDRAHSIYDVEHHNLAMLALMQQKDGEKLVPNTIYASGTGRHSGWVADYDKPHAYEGFSRNYQSSPSSQQLFIMTQERLRKFGMDSVVMINTFQRHAMTTQQTTSPETPYRPAPRQTQAPTAMALFAPPMKPR